MGNLRSRRKTRLEKRRKQKHLENQQMKFDTLLDHMLIKGSEGGFDDYGICLDERCSCLENTCRVQ